MLSEIDGQAVWEESQEKDDQGKVIRTHYELAHDFVMVDAMWNDAMLF